jgi:peptidoglycan-associated lipoprotein
MIKINCFGYTCKLRFSLLFKTLFCDLRLGDVGLITGGKNLRIGARPRLFKENMMLVRYFMIFAVMITVSACSTTEEETLPNEVPVREGISDGPLEDIYQTDASGTVPGTQADLVVNVGDRVFFGYDSYDISSEARMILDNQANWLAQYADLSITVEGHADERGTREYNLALSERRANAVNNYLVALGVDPRRVNVIAFGKERPAVAGANETAWSQNRRGVTKVN